MKEERLKILLANAIICLLGNSNIESSEVIDFLKNEIGFTDEELKEIVELL